MKINTGKVEGGTRRREKKKRESCGEGRNTNDGGRIRGKKKK